MAAASNDDKFDQPVVWELSKENVEPVKSGRDVHCIQAVLQPSEEDMERLLKEKQKFEEEIVAGENLDDPIAPWDRYLEWTIQNFPTGRNKKTLMNLLSKFIEKFKGGQYDGDSRYVNAWLKLAGIMDDPLEIYSFMNTEGIGRKCAAFYISWADEYEKCGDTKKADRIYNDGEYKGAQPFELLQKRHCEFQLRLARGMLNDDNDGQDAMEQRGALSQLEGRGKRGTVGSVRKGSTFRPLQNHDWGRKPNPSVAKQPQNFEIYQDDSENVTVMGQTGKWASIPSTATSKENLQQAGPWNSGMNRRSQRSDPVTPSLPDFQIYEDDDAANKSSLQQSRVLSKAGKVLSEKKEETQLNFSEIKSVLHEMPVHDGNAKSYYDAQKVYTVIGEMQFEEVRAAFWRKKQRLLAEQQRHLQEIQLEEQRARYIEQEQRRMQEEKKLLEDRATMAELERKLMEAERTKLNQSMWNLQTRLNKIRDMEKTAKTAEEVEILHREEENITVQLNALSRDLKGVSAKFQGARVVDADFKIYDENEEVKSLMVSSNKKQVSSANNSLNQSKRSQPSPTVNTKEAVSQVNAWLQKSLENEFEDTCGELSGAESQRSLSAHPHSFHASSSQQNNALKENCEPFEIFEEEKEGPVISVKPQQKKKGLCQRPAAPSLQTSDNNAVSASKEYPSNVDDTTAFYFDDETVAGSHFAARAHMASTPAGSKAGKLQDSTQINYLSYIHSDIQAVDCCLQANDDPCKQIEEPRTQECVMDDTAPQYQTTENVIEDRQLDNEDKQLSPIMEDSKESDKSSVTALKSSASHIESGTYIKNESNLVTIPEPVEKINFESVVPSTISDLASANLKNDTVASVASDGYEMNGSFDCNLWGSGTVKHSDKTTNEEESACDKSLQKDDRVEQHELCDNAVVKACSELDSICIAEKQPTTDSASVISNPWDDNILNSILEKEAVFLERCDVSISHYSGKLPVKLKHGCCLDLAGKLYKVGKVIGEGAYAKVYDIDSQESEKLVLKAQFPPCYWEVYAIATTTQRLRSEGLTDVAESVAVIQSAHIYNDCSLLLMPRFSRGTLLDMVNSAKTKELPKDTFATWIAHEIIKIVHGLHTVGIIHGDIKPDNFMLVYEDSKMSECKGSIKLIDFGRAIDMQKMPEHAMFTNSCGTSAFTCIQMQNNQPWNYHTDLYGIAGTLHVVLFGSYMKVKQSEEGIWEITGKLKRWYNTSFWKDFFKTLLNYPTPTDDKPVTLKDSPLPRLLAETAELLNHSPNVISLVHSIFRNL